MSTADDATTQPRPPTLARTARLNAGDRILHYRILEHLGKGGMGEVYLVRDETLQRDVAAKFLRNDLVGNAEAVARFQREATAAARITHENVVRIYSIEANAGDPFITANTSKVLISRRSSRRGRYYSKLRGRYLQQSVKGLQRHMLRR